MIHKYEAIKEGDTYTLYKDGIQSFCPKLNPFPVQGQFGGTEWARFPCNTGCPFANIIDDYEKLEVSEDKKEYYNNKPTINPFYTIRCEGSNVAHELSAIKNPRQESGSESPIIQL